MERDVYVRDLKGWDMKIYDKITKNFRFDFM